MNLQNKNKITPLVVFLLAILASGVAFWLVQSYEAQFVNDRMNVAVDDVASRLEERISFYDTTLLSASRLFSSEDKVTEQGWIDYISSTNLLTSLPGTVGTGYAPLVNEADKNMFAQNVRNNSRLEYRILPEGERPLYAPVLYYSSVNKTAEISDGYDLLSNTANREAMQTARDTGRISPTNSVNLPGSFGQRAILVYAPIYKTNIAQHINDVAQRRDAISGFIFSYVLPDFFFGKSVTTSQPDLRFQVFDGKDLSSGNLVYDSDPFTSQPGYASKFSDIRTIVWGGHEWTIRFVASPGFGLSNLQQTLPWVVLLVGLVLALALAFMMRMGFVFTPYALMTTAARVEDLTEQLGKKDAIIDIEPVALIVTDLHGNITTFNNAAEAKFGYKESEIAGNQSFLILISKNELAQRTALLSKKTGIKLEPSFDTIVTQSLIEGEDKTVWTFVDKKGDAFPATVVIKPVYGTGNQLQGYEFVI